jgi:putative ABC transport system permease protein
MRPALRRARRFWQPIAVSCFSLSIALALGVLALSVSNTILLLPPSAPDASRLVTLYSRAVDEQIGHFSYPDYLYYRAHNHVFADIAAEPESIGISEDIDDDGRKTKVVTRPVSENYFAVLGLKPYLGRFFEPGDDKTETKKAVMTWTCWKRLGSDLHIVGKAVLGRTIVGVTPPEYKGAFYGVNGDLLTNLTAGGGDREWFEQREERRLILTARLKPGVSRQQAQAEMTALAGQLASAYPKEDKGRTAVVTRASLLAPEMLSNMLWATGILMAVVLLVLLIACANVANLLLAAAVGRRQEAAIKLAIGAPRCRLIRDFLLESLALCAVSGVLGYAIAYAVAARFADFTVVFPMWGAFSFGVVLRLDGAVLGFSIALVVIDSLVTGLAPALYASSPALAQMLGGEIVVGGTRKSVRRNALVIVQVAVCTLVLVGMGLCQRDLYNLRHADLGFSARNVMAVGVFLRAEGYDTEARGKEFLARVSDATAAMPGVQSVALASDLPLLGGSVVDVQMPNNPKPLRVTHVLVNETYFSTLGLPLVAGRPFDASDREDAPLSVIVNQRMAQMFWPGKDPSRALGQTITAEKPPRKFTVVGVAANSKYEDLDEPPTPFMYYALSQNYGPETYVVARTRGNPNLWLASFRKVLHGLGLKLMAEPATFDEWLDLDLFGQRLAAWVVGILSALGLLLAMIGLLGAVSYSVGERKKELGIHVALGAQRGQLMAMVLRETAAVAGAGIAIGALLSVAVTAGLQSLLYRIGAIEWIVLLPATAGMLALSLAIACISAWPLLSIDPMEAVRHA